MIELKSLDSLWTCKTFDYKKDITLMVDTIKEIWHLDNKQKNNLKWFLTQYILILTALFVSSSRKLSIQRKRPKNAVLECSTTKISYQYLSKWFTGFGSFGFTELHSLIKKLSLLFWTKVSVIIRKPNVNKRQSVSWMRNWNWHLP